MHRDGEAHGVARRLEGVAREDPCRLVVAVPIGAGATPHRDHHMRTVRADHPHHVGRERLALPLPERLVGILREPEVVGPREELLCAIEPARREQLLAADRAERFAELVADEVLPTVAAREREVRHVHLVPAREPGEELRVLVVGVRADHEHARGGGEPAHQLVQRHRAARLPGGGARRGETQQGDEGRKQARPDHRYRPRGRSSSRA
jgi:hypothetical protein